MAEFLERALRARGIDPANVPPRSRVGRATRADGVPDSDAVRRLLAMPRREWWNDAITPYVVREMTAQFKTPGGTMTLFPHQAWALLEAIDHRAHFGRIDVGGGKTLLSALLPLTGPYRRPLIIQPSNLIEKTERDFLELSRHWRIARDAMRVVSAEMVGSHIAGPSLLHDYMPDIVIVDEAHLFKNRDAARTRRMQKYKDAHDPVVYTMSGTYYESGFRDFHHLQKWSLPPHLRILPDGEIELQAFADALDTEVEKRLAPGALRKFAPGATSLSDIRRGYGERIRSTPGVISVHNDDLPGCSITLAGDVFNDYGPAVDAAFDTLAAGTTTDGWPVKEAVVEFMHQWQYCLGYESYWNPRPPTAWSDALRAWSSQCRDVLCERIDGIDSPRMVANAIDRGLYPATALHTWRALRPTFRPNVMDRLIDPAMLEHAADWIDRMGDAGTVWTRHVPFGRRLAEMTGVPYFGAGGVTADGRSIESHRGRCILSIDANKQGRNLQDRYSKAYIVDPMGTCKDWEQLIGRFHRRGQKADTVSITVLLGCLGHYSAVARARSRATCVADTALAPRKIMLADWLIPSRDVLKSLDGPRWQAITSPGRDEFDLDIGDN